MHRLALLGFCFLLSHPLAADVVTRTYAQPAGDILKLDIHYPDDAEEASFPVLLWFHGGGWRNGSRENYKLVQWLTEEGYAIVSADYRLTGTAPFPAQRDDCLTALDWIRKHGKDHRLDAQHIVVAGLSAGAHLASLTGLYLSGESRDIKGILHFYGPSDFVSMMRYAKKDTDQLNQKESNVYRLFNGPLRENASLAKEASPVTYLDKTDPPILILVGTNDSLMTQRQCKLLHTRATAAGVASQLITIEGAGHGGPEFSDAKRKAEILNFLRSVSPGRSD